jgi:DNA-binding HxlR family transcriptional regulator
MRGYGQFCPVAVACEVFAERWTPLILREMFCGSRRFNDLRRGMPRISRTLLAQRLQALEESGVIESTPLSAGRGREYRLTPAGEEFRAVIDRLGEWGQRWIHGRFSLENLDATLLMWDIHRRIDLERLPAERVVARFDFRGFPVRYRGIRTLWLVLERPEVDLCLKDPGFEADVVVSADIKAMAMVWLGDLSLGAALRSRSVVIEGPRKWTQAFPGWLLLSGFAGVKRPPRALAI